jgi:2-oxoisovalerate dehydrogenase E1 component beta subunit
MIDESGPGTKSRVSPTSRSTVTEPSAPTLPVPGWFESSADAKAVSEDRRPSFLQAITAALEDELESDERVVLLGEDVGVMGGAFRVTKGLQERFGPDRVIDTPLAETAIVGASIGMAISGMRPIAELQFADFISCAYDQLVTEAAKLHFRFGIAVPMVVRGPSGAGVGAGPFHSQSPEGVFAHIPGLKIVCPGTVQDAYDLLRAAVADPNPVLFFEHKKLYRSLRGELERRPATADLGVAAVRRQGADVSVITYGGMLPTSLDAAAALEEEGIDVEVVDLRTVAPLDMETVGASVRKTSRVVIAHEDTLSSGIGAEVAARLADGEFFSLDAPLLRVAAPDCPVPTAPALEAAYVPTVERIREAVKACLNS